MAVLEAVVAVLVVAASIFSLRDVFDTWWPSRNWGLFACMALGSLGLGGYGYQVWCMREPHEVHAFLSQLLASLPPACDDIRKSVAWVRLIGELTGLWLGIVMTVIMSLPDAPTTRDLMRRHGALKQLLYAGSLLFVVGVLISQSTFAWILAQWPTTDEFTEKAVQAVISSGVVQSGVAYSALLVAFFAPVRLLLHVHVQDAMPKEYESTPGQRESWLKANGLGGTWQDDVRQIVAVLAPVVSAPIFDAIVKL